MCADGQLVGHADYAATAAGGEIELNVVERIQQRFNAEIVYGQAVETDGAVVIPGARVIGGGGGGSDAAHGEGGGFGLLARPAGAWVIRDGDARWKPVIDVSAIVLAGEFLAFSYFVFSRLTRRSKSIG